MPRHPNALLFRQFIYRLDLINDRDILFVFGDNLARWGFAGQAAEMRGEPNAVGLPTKRSPKEFLRNEDLSLIIQATARDRKRLLDHIDSGGQVIWPKQGIGTGRAQLAIRAPLVEVFYSRFLAQLSGE